jgi:hypothetical protein
MPDTTTADLEQLRTQHGLRGLEKEEEGSAAERLPNSVYGYTYSPAEATVPLFAKKTWHSFEVHKLGDGSRYLLGFVTRKEAETVRSGGQGEITLFPDPWEDATELVSVPYARAIPAKKGPSREGGNGLKVAIV